LRGKNVEKKSAEFDWRKVRICAHGEGVEGGMNRLCISITRQGSNLFGYKDANVMEVAASSGKCKLFAVLNVTFC
jgi:hypothetical protein